MFWSLALYRKLILYFVFLHSQRDGISGKRENSEDLGQIGDKCVRKNAINLFFFFFIGCRYAYNKLRECRCSKSGTRATGLRPFTANLTHCHTCNTGTRCTCYSCVCIPGTERLPCVEYFSHLLAARQFIVRYSYNWTPMM